MLRQGVILLFIYLLITTLLKRITGKKEDGKLKKAAVLEEKLRTAKAVILILSPDFEASEGCKADVSQANNYRKVRKKQREHFYEERMDESN